MEDLEKKKKRLCRITGSDRNTSRRVSLDRKQTMESLRALSIEEVYELGDAILAGETWPK